MQVVDDQDHAATVGELREDAVDHRPPSKSGVADGGVRTGHRRLSDRAEQGEPELLGVLLVARDLHDGERVRLARSAHVRSSDVFPLPAGAEMIVTFLAAARSSAATRSTRSISRGPAGATFWGLPFCLRLTAYRRRSGPSVAGPGTGCQR